jgi:hypothetical protein
MVKRNERATEKVIVERSPSRRGAMGRRVRHGLTTVRGNEGERAFGMVAGVGNEEHCA